MHGTEPGFLPINVNNKDLPPPGRLIFNCDFYWHFNKAWITLHPFVLNKTFSMWLAYGYTLILWITPTPSFDRIVWRYLILTCRILTEENLQLGSKLFERLKDNICSCEGFTNGFRREFRPSRDAFGTNLFVVLSALCFCRMTLRERQTLSSLISCRHMQQGLLEWPYVTVCFNKPRLFSPPERPLWSLVRRVCYNLHAHNSARPTAQHLVFSMETTATNIRGCCRRRLCDGLHAATRWRVFRYAEWFLDSDPEL